MWVLCKVLVIQGRRRPLPGPNLYHGGARRLRLPWRSAPLCLLLLPGQALSAALPTPASSRPELPRLPPASSLTLGAGPFLPSYFPTSLVTRECHLPAQQPAPTSSCRGQCLEEPKMRWQVGTLPGFPEGTTWGPLGVLCPTRDRWEEGAGEREGGEEGGLEKGPQTLWVWRRCRAGTSPEGAIDGPRGARGSRADEDGCPAPAHRWSCGRDGTLPWATPLPATLPAACGRGELSERGSPSFGLMAWAKPRLCCQPAPCPCRSACLSEHCCPSLGCWGPQPLSVPRGLLGLCI